MKELVLAAFGFVLTGIVGNLLLQHWQHRSWVRQQTFLGREKEYAAFKLLTEQISKETGARLYHMKRVERSINSTSVDDEEFERRVHEYATIVVKWNESLNSYYVQLSQYADRYVSIDLQEYIQLPFSVAGRDLEAAIAGRRGGRPKDVKRASRLRESLEDLQARIYAYNRKLIVLVEAERELVYFGRKISYSKNNLMLFSTFDLIKSIFVRDVDRHTIFRSA